MRNRTRITTPTGRGGKVTCLGPDWSQENLHQMVYPVGLSATLSNHLQDIKTESKKVSFDDGYVCFKVFTIIHGCFNDVSTTEVSPECFS
jgi:hypothetical protein